jgi:hypothetical protein
MCTTVVRRIPVAAFLAMLDEHDLLGDYVCYLAERIAEQQDVITDFATLPSENRLAAVLLLLGRTIGVRMPGAGEVRLADRINYQELADMVGTTRSRVGRFVQRLSAESCVRLDRGILVLLDTDELAVRARHSLPPNGHTLALSPVTAADPAKTRKPGDFPPASLASLASPTSPGTSSFTCPSPGLSLSARPLAAARSAFLDD